MIVGEMYMAVRREGDKEFPDMATACLSPQGCYWRAKAVSEHGNRRWKKHKRPVVRVARFRLEEMDE